MISPTIHPNFSSLLSIFDAELLLQRLNELDCEKTCSSSENLADPLTRYTSIKDRLTGVILLEHPLAENNEQAITDWLILLFNALFVNQRVILVRGTGEPEYFPAQNNQPARIEFAHGFFASALHEISHFCVAGQRRRQLSDFGYWYAPDGRSAAQQQAFERVEIKPQALECLFTLACRRPFQVSQDNLFADFDTSNSTFPQDVYQQVKTYIAKPHTLPADAKTLLQALLTSYTMN
ncbi:elongation factor P hydroxylase [Psychrobacter sp. DAB_AL62B]|uniref:elongation factor P hydroxylase n=1 Tax=Psychrobacter sp. DAB_AL62B TaxID=1028420 RepID=UPI0023816EFF|nr:elongation factor P hydroxylase [Psychrobacter sp. DAB_AL62B]MDE4455549.1 hypothetical protein [Psychrobacter sp. DAB_AL62B]